MARLSITWADIEGLRRFDNMLGALAEDAPKVAARALNHTGDIARTVVIRQLSAQSGLKQKIIRKGLKTTRASWGKLSYDLSISGGDIALKYFGARETRRGVSAQPFGKRQRFAGTFIKGGRFPGRVALNMGGHVFARTSGDRTPIELQKSGVVLPTEMLKGATADGFLDTVRKRLPGRVEHEIKQLGRGVIS